MEQREQIRDLSRGASEAPSQSAGSKRKRNNDEDGETDDLAIRAGKKFCALYYMWGTREQIFGEDAADDDNVEDEVDQEEADEQEQERGEEQDAAGDLGGDEQAAVDEGPYTEEGIYNVQSLAGKTAFRKAQVALFRHDNPHLITAWKTKEYQSQARIILSLLFYLHARANPSP